MVEPGGFVGLIAPVTAAGGSKIDLNIDLFPGLVTDRTLTVVFVVENKNVIPCFGQIVFPASCRMPLESMLSTVAWSVFWNQ